MKKVSYGVKNLKLKPRGVFFFSSWGPREEVDRAVKSREKRFPRRWSSYRPGLLMVSSSRTISPSYRALLAKFAFSETLRLERRDKSVANFFLFSFFLSLKRITYKRKAAETLKSAGSYRNRGGAQEEL